MNSTPVRRATLATIIASALSLALPLLLLAPQQAAAASYWWSGTPAAGSNGFSFTSADQPWWNPWTGHGRCETRGATIPAGNPCVLTWHVPAHLDARAGSISGTYKQANPAFEQRNVVECNGTTTLQGTSAIQSFTRTWPDMCGYLNIWLLTPASAASVSAGSQFFNATGFSVELIDPHPPTIELVSGHTGWKGPGGACVRYVFNELGSGLDAASLVNLTTGQVLDAPGWASAAIVTGVGRSDRTPCMSPPGSGTFTLRAAAVDKAGNHASHDVQVSFDVTPPALGTPHVDGTPLANGRTLHGSAGEYRPTFTIDATDAHSGIAATQVLLDGAVVAAGTSWRSSHDLAPGTHAVEFRVTDAVGNVASATRSFVVVDDVAPSITVASPDAAGGSSPVLDVTADDDLAGLDATTWTVRVNGEVLVAGSDTRRLQADVGLLVDGTHRIEVRIADIAGNVATRELAYLADSGDELPDPPAAGGLFLVDAPDVVEEGTTHRVLAIASRAGRPVGGRYELRHGEDVLAATDATELGVVDLSAKIDVPGPLHLHPPAGSGLEAALVAYEFVPAPAPIDPCIAQPLSAGCDDDGGDDDDGDGNGDGDGGPGTSPPPPGPVAPAPTIINVQAPAPAAAGGGAAPQPGAAHVAPGAPYPRDIVYYVNGVPHWNGLPLAESGGPKDRVAPRWRLRLLRERGGVVKRTGRIALRLWTSEMTVLSLAPQGSPRRISVNPRRKLRTIHVRYDRRSPLGRRIARTRPGRTVVVRMRIVATDKNENRTRPRMLTFRVRV